MSETNICLVDCNRYYLSFGIPIQNPTLLASSKMAWNCPKNTICCILYLHLFFTGGRHSAAVKRLLRSDKDVGSNTSTAATRNENGHWKTPHRRWPSGPTGSKWKSSDVKLN